MSAPRFRRYTTPLGIALIAAIVGRSIAVRLQPEFGIWATLTGIAILATGLMAAIFVLWRNRKRGRRG